MSLPATFLVVFLHCTSTYGKSDEGRASSEKSGRENSSELDNFEDDWGDDCSDLDGISLLQVTDLSSDIHMELF